MCGSVAWGVHLLGQEDKTMSHSQECMMMNDRSARELCTCDLGHPAYIPSDGYADGGEPYTEEELTIINQRQAMKNTARGRTLESVGGV